MEKRSTIQKVTKAPPTYMWKITANLTLSQTCNKRKKINKLVPVTATTHSSVHPARIIRLPADQQLAQNHSSYWHNKMSSKVQYFSAKVICLRHWWLIWAFAVQYTFYTSVRTVLCCPNKLCYFLQFSSNFFWAFHTWTMMSMI